MATDGKIIRLEQLDLFKDKLNRVISVSGINKADLPSSVSLQTADYTDSTSLSSIVRVRVSFTDGTKTELQRVSFNESDGFVRFLNNDYILDFHIYLDPADNYATLYTNPLGTIDSIPQYQATTTIVGNALTNMNGRVLTNFEQTSQSITINNVTYDTIVITYQSAQLTYEKAQDYMEYMTGSRFVPTYSLEKPQNSIWIMADGTVWKPQFDSTSQYHFQLWKISGVTASNNNNLQNGTGTGSVQEIQDGSGGTFDFTNKNPNATALDGTLTGQIAYGGVGNYSSSFGGKSQASGKRSLAQGTTTVAKGNYSHAEGDNSVAYGNDSHAEGFATLSAGLASHTEGTKTQVLTTLPESGGGGDTPVDPPSGFLPDEHRGEASHSEGSLTTVYGFSSHAEGANTIVKGHYAHAEGVSTMAVGAGSKSYGNHSTANGDYSVAGGSYTTANQIGSFAHGYGASTYAEYSTAFGDNTQTVRRAQFVIGIYNVGRTTTLFEVGNGDDNYHRGNAFEVHSDGRATIGAAPTNAMDVVNKGAMKTVNGQSLFVTGSDTNLQISVNQTGLFKHEVEINDGSGTNKYMTVVNSNSSQLNTMDLLDTYNFYTNCLRVLYGGQLVCMWKCTLSAGATVNLSIVVCGKQNNVAAIYEVSMIGARIVSDTVTAL